MIAPGKYLVLESCLNRPKRLWFLRNPLMDSFIIEYHLSNDQR